MILNQNNLEAIELNEAAVPAVRQGLLVVTLRALALIPISAVEFSLLLASIQNKSEYRHFFGIAWLSQA